MVHDEFSYLLSADTFASGRLTNPTHPMWVFFESFHIIHQPTYASKYPPGQGLFLALGQLVWHPILGVWLSTAFAVAATTWMLQGWMPQRWALFGGLIAATNPVVNLVWGASYWGGSVAMLGGALVLGALPRLECRDRFHHTAILGLGILLLANSRPYEGLAITIASFLHFAWTVRHSAARRTTTGMNLKSWFSLALVLILGFSWMAYYNYRVTHNPMKMPYQVHEQTYGSTPLFLFGTPREDVTFRHTVMQRLQDKYLRIFERARDWQTYIGTKRRQFGQAWKKLSEEVSLFLILASIWAVYHRRAVFFLVVVALTIGTQLITTWTLIHYLAPGAPAAIALGTCGIREVYCSFRRNVVFRKLLVLLLFAFLITETVCAMWNYHDQAFARTKTVRQDAISHLKATDCRHLVIVRYRNNHNVNHESVYNEANIDSAQIVWAREMDEVSNRRLLNYFSDRKAWLFQPDLEGLSLEPYPDFVSESQ